MKFIRNGYYLRIGRLELERATQDMGCIFILWYRKRKPNIVISIPCKEN
jgi:hypothetical protein